MKHVMIVLIIALNQYNKSVLFFFIYPKKKRFRKMNISGTAISDPSIENAYASIVFIS